MTEPKPATSSKILDDQQPCPCGSTKKLSVCCQPLLDGQPANSAEQLMRSRYTAFFLGNADYLESSTHSSLRAQQEQKEITASLQEQTWLSLRILETQKGGEKDKQGMVEFVAYYDHADHHHHHHGEACGGLHQLHERAYFVKENNHWYYSRGEFLKPIKLGRNDPCWCGNGKKFKQCHGAD